MYRANPRRPSRQATRPGHAQAHALERLLRLYTEHSQHAAEASTTHTLGPDATAGCSAPPGSRRRDARAPLSDFNARPTHSPHAPSPSPRPPPPTRVATAVAELLFEDALVVEELPAASLVRRTDRPMKDGPTAQWPPAGLGAEATFPPDTFQATLHCSHSAQSLPPPPIFCA